MMITCFDVTKKYGDIRAVNGISLAVDEGDFVGILGESGSGNSTLLYLLSGLLAPTQGSIIVDGKDLATMRDRELSSIRPHLFGFIFQAFNLLPGMSVVANLEMPLLLAKNPAKHRDNLFGLLEKVGLSECAHRNVEELSGGQQQRVAIARALMNNPKIIFADGPTANLDSKNTGMIVDLVGELNQRLHATILMVTHGEKTLAYCTRVITLVDGEVQER